jgi:hypothetical protein
MTTTPQLPQKLPRRPFLDNEIEGLDEFAEANPLHDHCVVAAYHIYRDLFIKRELTSFKLVDASKWGKNEYFIQGECRDSPYSTRLLIPYHLDAELDLHWLHDFATEWLNESRELYVAIHTAETIIYQSVHNVLPGM